MANSDLSLKLANSQLKKDVAALKREVGKLQTQNAKFKADNVSLRLKVKALEKLKVPQKPDPVSEFETVRRIAFMFAKHGLHIVTSNDEEVSSDNKT